jgi:outer membrane protein TolC
VIADLQLQQRVVGLEASVRTAYLGMVAAVEGRKVAQQNMDLAQQSLENARARVAVGQAPQIDIITSEATVESFREQLILADASIARSEDNLRSIVLDPNRPDYWQVHLEPTDPIRLTQRQVDEDAAIQNALANRLDLVSLRRSMEITDLNLKLNQDLTKPSVDLQMTYSAKGTGGRQASGVNSTDFGFGGVLGDAFKGTYPNWTWGVNVGYPLGRSSAEAAVAQSQLQKQQQTLNQRDLEVSIVQDVRQAARDVRTTWQRVQATQAARAAVERQLEAEERKFAVGLSDTFTLQSRQTQLASARINELNAIVAYNLSLIELERVQKIR